jgi:hypothetical protein
MWTQDATEAEAWPDSRGVRRVEAKGDRKVSASLEAKLGRRKTMKKSEEDWQRRRYQTAPADIAESRKHPVDKRAEQNWRKRRRETGSDGEQAKLT